MEREVEFYRFILRFMEMVLLRCPGIPSPLAREWREYISRWQGRLRREGEDG